MLRVKIVRMQLCGLDAVKRCDEIIVQMAEMCQNQKRKVKKMKMRKGEEKKKEKQQQHRERENRCLHE